MPFLIALAGAAVAFYFFVIRARNAANVAGDLADMATDIAGAARRFGFRRRANVHPVEAIEDQNLCAASIAVAFLELDELPTQEQRNAMLVAIQKELNLSLSDAEEITVLGRWFVSECGGAAPAVARLSRKAYKLGGPALVQPVLAMIQASAQAGSGTLSERQTSALSDINRAFHLK